MGDGGDLEFPHAPGAPHVAPGLRHHGFDAVLARVLLRHQPVGVDVALQRQLTVGNIERIQKYLYLKNGAMYSVLVLGVFMVTESFGLHLPVWISPITTFGIVGFFFLKSRSALVRS